MEDFQGGWIMVITGGMFAGKSEELMRTMRRFSHAQKTGAIFKPQLDTRSGDNCVTTHNGDKIQAVVVDSVSGIRLYLKEHSAEPLDVVAVDEAQFLETAELLVLAKELASRGVRVIIAVLDKKWDGSHFEGVGDLLAEADIDKRLHAVCVDCGHLASHSLRVSASTADVEVGDNYKPVCRSCFNQAMAERA